MGTNLIQQLRLRDLFGNQPVFGGQVNRQPLFETPEITIPTNVPETPTRSTPFQDQYRNVLLNAPRREDYQSGKLGKVLALAAGTLTGATQGAERGINVGRNLLDRRYNEAAEDYNSKVGRFRELAGLEHTAAIENRKLEIDTRKLGLEEFKALSQMRLDDARAQELLDRIKTSGRKLERNETTGQLEVVDIKTGLRQTLGKFAETPTEKDVRAKGMFSYQEGIRQSGRERLEGMRFKNDEKLARIKADLDKRGNNVTQNNAAFEGAMAEALFNNPELKKRLYEEDDNGDLVLKDKYDPKDYQTFVAKVNQRMNAKLGKSFNEVNFPSVDVPEENAPTITDPNQDALRQTAIQFLRENNFEEDEASIQEAMKQIGAVAAEETNAPEVTAPIGAWGPISYEGGNFKNIFSAPNFSNVPNIIPSRERPGNFGSLLNPSGLTPTQREMQNRGVNTRTGRMR